jgi:alpha-pyrone synthase
MAHIEIDQSVLIAIIAVLLVLVIGLVNRKPVPKQSRVYPVLRGLATGNPKYRVSQEDAMKIAHNVPGVDSVRDMIPRIYMNSKIGFRYMAVPDFTPNQIEKGDEFFYNGNYQINVQTRLEKFRKEAIPLTTSVCERAIANAGITKDQVSKLIVVSSTGFLGPGLDCELIRSLGLSRAVDRSLIGFMGCAAAMNGFRIANDFVKCNPGKHALMVCIEISSVHTVFEDNINDTILHAIFADGCAAAIISGETRETARKGDWAIVDDHAWLMEGTEDGITLSINNNGISCTLSKYLPQYIAKNMAGYVEGFLTKNKLTKEEIDFWAVHPGGRRIIEEAQNGLGLTEEQCSESWDILYNYGNMLSPSVMFVLEKIFAKNDRLVAEGKAGLKQGLAFSFSPGVGAEGILIQRL